MQTILGFSALAIEPMWGMQVLNRYISEMELAAYGAMAATDEVIASNNLSKLGSIGAVITLDKVFLQWYGETFLSFYGENAPLKQKEIRSALAGDFSPIQRSANEATDEFQSQVRAMRSLSGGDKYQSDTLSGDVFDAVISKRRGLIDGIGNLNYVIGRANAWTKKYNQEKKRA